jgi:hypothetical protein
VLLDTSGLPRGGLLALIVGYRDDRRRTPQVPGLIFR